MTDMVAIDDRPGLAQPTGRREERRRDRLTAAQISREDEAARARASVAVAGDRARLRREQYLTRSADRKTARKQHAARWAKRMAWLNAHVTDLLFIPVIVVPGVLAWTAMGAFGSQVFGRAGVSLPAFSEGAMWAFAGATTIMFRQHPERPAWFLRLGTAVFACFGAALNFIHGMTPEPGALRGPGIGVVMALVSVAGVVAHQLITAGPHRSRSERAAVRTDKAVARRERVIRRAALKRATAVLDADGSVRLVHTPGMVEMTRHRGRVILAEVPAPPVPEPTPEARPWPREAPVLELPAPPQTLPSEVRQESVKPRPAGASNSTSNETSKPAAGKRQNGASSLKAKRTKAELLLRGNPGLSSADLVRTAGVSKSTADRIRAEMDPPRRLHVAEG
jgi:hypothetical protein